MPLVLIIMFCVYLLLLLRYIFLTFSISFLLLFCQTLDEATNLLGATCDTFIKTLEECIHIVNTSLNDVPVPVHTSIPPLPHNQSKSRVSISSEKV